MIDSNHISTRNKKINISFDLVGGAIVDFSLIEQNLNPLNFHFPAQVGGDKEFYYKGHFLCLPRWGDPTPGEHSAGLNKHGDFIRLRWTARADDNSLTMSAVSLYEDMFVERVVETSAESGCVKVTERVRNENLSARFFNMVQHPTLAAPFLDDHTIVDCNAATGFDYSFHEYSDDIMCQWPEVRTAAGDRVNLRCPQGAYNSVFSFIVNTDDEYGWITACSPTQHLMIGYCWKRADYPWLNHWLHYDGSHLKYRGLEFGTTGVHKPINELFDKDLMKLLGQNTVCLLDSDELQERSYYMFLHSIPASWQGVEKLETLPASFKITERGTTNEITIPHTFNNSYGL